MGIDISKIKNEMLQIIAKGVNIMDDDEKTLNETEVSLFKFKAGKLLENKMITEEELNQAYAEMGLAVERTTSAPVNKEVAKDEAPKAETVQAEPAKAPKTQKEFDAQFVKDLEKAEGKTPRRIKKSMVANAQDAETKAYYDSLKTDEEYLVAASRKSVIERRKELNGENVKEELGVDENGNVNVKKISRSKLMRKSFVAYTNNVVKEGAAPIKAIRKLTDKITPYLKSVDFDMTAVSDKIKEFTGDDYCIDGSKQGATEELKHIASELNRMMGLEGDNKLTEDEAMRLADYCGFRVAVRESKLQKGVEGLKHLLHDAGIGAAAGALGSYVAASSAVKEFTKDMKPDVWTQVVTHIQADITQNVNINNQVYAGNEFHQGLDIVNDVITNKEEFLAACKDPEAYAAAHALDGALVGALVGIGIKAIEATMDATIGQEIPFEEAVQAESLAYRNNDPEFQTVDAYKKRLVREYGSKASSLIDLAEEYTQDGKFDVNAYITALNNIAGPGSVMSPDEMRGAELFGAKKSEKTPDVKPAKPQQGEPTVYVKQETPKGENEVPVKETVSHPHERQYGDTWAGIVKAYYPELAGNLYGKNGAIAALKKALAYEQDGTFNKEKYQRLLTDKNLPEKMLLPDVLMGINFTDGKVKPATAKELGNGGSNKSLKQVGRTYERVSTRKVTENGETKYIARDGETSQTAVGTTKDEAVKNLENATGKKYKPENVQDEPQQ